MPRTGGEKRKSTLVEEAIRQFGREGYNGASLDQIATAVGVRKQTLLYYFPTKDALLEACLSAAGERLVLEIAQALEGKETYWDRAEAVIHSVFSLAEQWPEFPMFIREAGRLGPDAFARFAGVLIRCGCARSISSSRGWTRARSASRTPPCCSSPSTRAWSARSPRRAS